MRSANVDATVETPSEARVLYRLLEPVFGLFIWAMHFLAVYAATAVACVLGLGAADVGVRSTFTATLVAVTVAAAAGVGLHALTRYRRQEKILDRRFLMEITLALDAIAALGILWQLFPILMVPVCQ
jgi:Bacterial signalling protein N terminal repeat